MSKVIKFTSHSNSADVNRVCWSFPDDTVINASSTKIEIGSPATEVILDMNTSNAEVVTGVTLPSGYVNCKFHLVDGSFVEDENYVAPRDPRSGP
jgi:hypothetical protein